VRARQRILREHTAAHRAEQLEGYACDLLDARQRRSGRVVVPAQPRDAELVVEASAK
jgi:DNA-directed RNA polymerase subunit K/omega